MTTPLVSIIIPTKNAERGFSACLESIVNQSYAPKEIIIVDNYSTDQTLTIAKRYPCQIISGGPERSSQRNLGAHAAHGEFVFMIDADMKLDQGLLQESVKLFQNHPNLLALVIPETSQGKGHWAACKSFEKTLYLGVTWMEAARVFRTKTLKELGGYNETIVAGEDYDLPHRLEKKIGPQSIGRTHHTITTYEDVIRLIPLWKKKFYYGKHGYGYQKIPANKKYFYQQANILNRFLLLAKKPRVWLRHPLLTLGFIFLKTWEFSALTAGYLTSAISQTRQ